MKIEDTFSVRAPIDTVWRFIRDPDQVAPCIPGCEAVEVTGPNTYRANIKVALGPIKTTFKVTVELTKEEAPCFAATTTRGEEGGKASTLSAQSELRLRPLDALSTEVTYSSEVSIFGRLGRYGLGMMKKKAQSLGGEFAKSFSARVEQGAGIR
jgi:hypothetical protein